MASPPATRTHTHTHTNKHTYTRTHTAFAICLCSGPCLWHWEHLEATERREKKVCLSAAVLPNSHLRYSVSCCAVVYQEGSHDITLSTPAGLLRAPLPHTYDCDCCCESRDCDSGRTTETSNSLPECKYVCSFFYFAIPPRGGGSGKV